MLLPPARHRYRLPVTCPAAGVFAAFCRCKLQCPATRYLSAAVATVASVVAACRRHATATAASATSARFLRCTVISHKITYVGGSQLQPTLPRRHRHSFEPLKQFTDITAYSRRSIVISLTIIYHASLFMVRIVHATQYRSLTEIPEFR